MTLGKAAISVLLGTSLSHGAAARELLSLNGIKLANKEYISGFRIETWGVRVFAVCRFPFGWTITAGQSADPSGVLEGAASLGVTFLNAWNADQLENLFLVDVSDYQPLDRQFKNQPGSLYPASFHGELLIGRYGTDPTIHHVTMANNNIVRRSASQCPPP